MAKHENGFGEYKKLILYQFDQHGKKIDNLTDKLDNLLAVTLPDIKMDAVREATASSTRRGLLWGGLSLLISVTGLVIAMLSR